MRVMNAFTTVFLILLALDATTRAWLAWRHIRYIRKHQDEVPGAFTGVVTPHEHRKAAEYTIAKTRLGMAELGWSSALLLVWTVGGGLDWLDRLWLGFGQGPTLTGVGFLVSAVVIMGALDLPAAAYRTFVIEARFGFNRTTVGLFMADTLKALALMLALGILLAWLALWVMQATGAWWWAWLWLVWMVFTLVMAWVYPTFIAPLFNRFEPLPEGPLRDRIMTLVERCGFGCSGIFVMDGSRRTGHGNAYFTGVGRSKRIVFFDTLIETMEAPETVAVLAHELGHFRRHHVRKRLLLMGGVSLAALACLGWLAQQPQFYAGLGMGRATPQAALILFLLLAPLVSLFLQPLSAWLMRLQEFEADSYAAEQAGPEHLVRALVKLYRENACTLTPDPLFSAFHDSHPSASVRVRHLSSKMLS